VALKDGSDFCHVLLDMTEADLERLPLVEDVLAEMTEVANG
jgi:hypothetical protein